MVQGDCIGSLLAKGIWSVWPPLLDGNLDHLLRMRGFQDQFVLCPTHHPVQIKRPHRKIYRSWVIAHIVEGLGEARICTPETSVLTLVEQTLVQIRLSSSIHACRVKPHHLGGIATGIRDLEVGPGLVIHFWGLGILSPGSTFFLRLLHDSFY